MQNSYTFNGFNSIDLMNLSSKFEASTTARRSSLGNIGLQNNQNSQNLFSQSQNNIINSSQLISSEGFSPLFQYNESQKPLYSSSFIENSPPQQDSQSQLLQYIQHGQNQNQSNPTQYENFNPTQQDSFAKYLRQSNYSGQKTVLTQPVYNIRSTIKPTEQRRNSLCSGLCTLRPVHESRPSSPNLFTHDSILLSTKSGTGPGSHQRRIGLPISESHQKMQDKIHDHDLNNIKYGRKLSFDSNVISFKPRYRINSLGSNSSFDSSNSINRLDISEEKLAKTGNIFQRRVDWSIISKLPINKQNTIHIRLEDEGPYGNDETRCFVLSHLSSLNVRSLFCIFCQCELVVFDRFPLIDGTLFVSPYLYDEKLAVRAFISNKDQFIYAICLDCLSGNGKKHEINCVSCKQAWTHGNSLQIGTLYKYDIFAATPCCQIRMSCNQCDKPLLDLIKTGGLPYFSMYSEERICDNCRSNDFHFIKSLEKIFDVTILDKEKKDKHLK